MNDKANLLILIASVVFVFLISLVPDGGGEIDTSGNVGGLFLPFIFFILIPMGIATNIIIKLSAVDEDQGIWEKIFFRIFLCTAILGGLVFLL